MDYKDLWKELLTEFQNHLNILPDKPEETPESTLKALWFTAAGEPISCEAAAELEIYDLDSSQQALLKKLADQRMQGVPLAHLTGRQQFMGVELLAGPEALVPRKETELLGWAALKKLKELGEQTNNSLIMIDICTGAGNLAVALTALYKKVRTYAADLSEEAVELARKNVAFCNLDDKIEVRCGDLLHPFDSPEFYGQVDLLLCNPPYISSSKVPVMPAEIAGHEPKLAFDGGPFGIKILNRLIKEAPRFLKSGGWLAFEVGLGQGKAVQKRLDLNPEYDSILSVTDNQGHIRALLARKR